MFDGRVIQALFFLSFSVSVSPSPCDTLYLFPCLFVALCLPLSLCLFFSLPLSLCLFLWVSLFLALFFPSRCCCLSLCLSVCLLVSLYFCRSPGFPHPCSLFNLHHFLLTTATLSTLEASDKERQYLYIYREREIYIYICMYLRRLNPDRPYADLKEAFNFSPCEDGVRSILHS